MQAIINGVTVIGTPQEIAEYQRISAETGKAPNFPKPTPTNPWILGTAKPKGSYYTWNGPVDSIWG